MDILRNALCVALTLASLQAVAADDNRIAAGRQVFERYCQTCHGVTGPAASGTGPDLRGIVGRKAGSEDGGIHSRAALDSDIVWSRESLRRYVLDPDRAMPGTLMSPQMLAPEEVEELLDYLENLR